MKIVFVHLDLGIGGAEALVLASALALHRAGHEVWLYTSHHDQSHSFAALRAPDGELSARVRVLGDWLPRSLFGRAVALCSVVRMLYIALALCCVVGRVADVIFCDGVSAPVPLLRLRAPVLFYCHFPDKLLVTRARSALTRAYRLPLDWLEEATTGCADVIAVNSHFTARIFRESFARVGARRAVEVLYPAINFSAFEGASDAPAGGGGGGGRRHIVSLNRFERKKNVALAIEALAHAHRALGARERARAPRLVVAGGYDSRVVENVEHLAELEALVAARGLGDVVEFKPSIADAERVELLSSALCVLYTPDNEHFGIVPIEAMYVGAPVVAVASGGPLETVKHGETGFLVEGIEHFLGIGETGAASLHRRAGRLDRGARLGVRHLQLERQRMILGDPREGHADHIRDGQPQLGQHGGGFILQCFVDARAHESGSGHWNLLSQADNVAQLSNNFNPG